MKEENSLSVEAIEYKGALPGKKDNCWWRTEGLGAVCY